MTDTSSVLIICTSSSISFYFQLTRVHSALEFFGRCVLRIYLLTHFDRVVLGNASTVVYCARRDGMCNENEASGEHAGRHDAGRSLRESCSVHEART